MSSIFFALATLKARFEEADKERGATAIEYALIVGLVSIGLVVAMMTIGIGTFVESIKTWIEAQSVPST